VEGLLEAVAADGHQFCTHSNSNLDAARGNLVRDVLCSLETRGAESVYRGGGGGVWEASCEGSSSELVRSFAIGDLEIQMLADERGRRRETYIAAADVLDELRIDFRFLDDLLEQRIDEVIQLSIFESALEAFGKWCSDRESNYYIVGILGRADNGT
jgi:hypothetical protein